MSVPCAVVDPPVLGALAATHRVVDVTVVLAELGRSGVVAGSRVLKLLLEDLVEHRKTTLTVELGLTAALVLGKDELPLARGGPCLAVLAWSRGDSGCANGQVHEESNLLDLDCEYD